MNRPAFRSSSVLVAATLAFGLAACDKKEAAPADPQGDASVAEGAKARTAVGEQVEIGKQRVEAAEAKLQARDAAMEAQLNQEGAATQQRGMGQ